MAWVAIRDILIDVCCKIEDHWKRGNWLISNLNWWMLLVDVTLLWNPVYHHNFLRRRCSHFICFVCKISSWNISINIQYILYIWMIVLFIFKNQNEYFLFRIPVKILYLTPVSNKKWQSLQYVVVSWNSEWPVKDFKLYKDLILHVITP